MGFPGSFSSLQWRSYDAEVRQPPSIPFHGINVGSEKLLQRRAGGGPVKRYCGNESVGKKFASHAHNGFRGCGKKPTFHSPQPLGWGTGSVILIGTISMVFQLILTKRSSSPVYSRLWTHRIWETLNRERMLDKRAVIVRGRMRKSTRCLLSGRGWSGGERETIKMVPPASNAT